MFIDADNIASASIDLNRELVCHPAATFYARVKGNAMADMGVEDGDVLIIDRALELSDGCMVVCYIDNEFVLRRVAAGDGRVWLVTADGGRRELDPGNDTDTLWGVVAYCIKDVRHSRLQ